MRTAWLDRLRRCAGKRATALALVLLALCGAAGAAPAPWPEVSYSYLARGERVAGVLRSFCRSFGLQLRLSDGVEAHRPAVDGTLVASTPGDFLNQLSATHGLAWFYQGGALYVSRQEEQVMRVLPMPGSGGAALKKALGDLGFLEAKFGWADIPDRQAAIVSGPPAYVDALQRMLAEMPLPPAASEQQLRIFRLRHAAVDDRVIYFRDKQIVTTGVANLLRGLVSGKGGAGTSIQMAEMAAPLRNSLAPATPMASVAAPEPAPAGEPGRRDAAGSGREGGDRSAPRRAATDEGAGLATVQSDSRLNALVIRARADQLKIYEQLIALLDVPSPLVEIEAMIVDINKTKLTSLGVDWGVRAGKLTAGFGIVDQAATSTSATLGMGAGMTPGSTVATAGSYVASRIALMEQDGDARVVSRPSVLTIDNLGALIDLTETFYIKVTGERAANVVPVSVGVTLRVTPHIIPGPDGPAVHLTVDIEDGAIQDPVVGDIPTVRRSTIGTQAVMAENQSLLVAGFNSERDAQTDAGVPGLRRLPWLGALFNKKSGDVQKRERMFLITPRIVQSAAASAAASATAAGMPAGVR